MSELPKVLLWTQSALGQVYPVLKYEDYITKTEKEESIQTNKIDPAIAKAIVERKPASLVDAIAAHYPLLWKAA
jgi:hypothetical protein